jgi:hypothetical protein
MLGAGDNRVAGLELIEVKHMVDILAIGFFYTLWKSTRALLWAIHVLKLVLIGHDD